MEASSGGGERVVEGERASRYTQRWRGGRVVECGGLENRYVGNPGVGGSNPPLSARLRRPACQHAPTYASALSRQPSATWRSVRRSQAQAKVSLARFLARRALATAERPNAES